MDQDNTMTNRLSRFCLLMALALATGVGIGGAPDAVAQTKPAAAVASANFASADDAVAALIAALRNHDGKAVLSVLGAGSEKLIFSGDRVADAQARDNFLAAYDAKHALVPGDH
jgi:hypothetical protein